MLIHMVRNINLIATNCNLQLNSVLRKDICQHARQNFESILNPLS